MGIHDRIELVGLRADKYKYKEKRKIDEKVASDPTKDVAERLAASMRCPENSIKQILAEERYEELRKELGIDDTEEQNIEEEEEQEKEESKRERMRGFIHSKFTHSDNTEQSMTGLDKDKQENK